METKVAVYESQVENYEKALHQEREESQIQLERERESSRRLMDELSQSKSNSESLKLKNTMLEAEISIKDATIKGHESELDAKTKALKERDTVVSGLSEQLIRVRENLSSKQQVSSQKHVLEEK